MLELLGLGDHVSNCLSEFFFLLVLAWWAFLSCDYVNDLCLTFPVTPGNSSYAIISDFMPAKELSIKFHFLLIFFIEFLIGRVDQWFVLYIVMGMASDETWYYTLVSFYYLTAYWYIWLTAICLVNNCQGNGLTTWPLSIEILVSKVGHMLHLIQSCHAILMHCLL